ncbi:MAG: hypothetical protein COB45_08445 [Gammaproteobacteria bacterium]|nr:MAG: hypothetical protein COB45_08445 [Gammaproteobacteria bacterium]PHR81618.1 MAG: hypothetical protein COA59_15560 [Colwellia sp.]
MKIYYESDPILGINITYDFNGERHHDFFSSFYLFNAWVSLEFFNVELIEITDSNYPILVQKGLI